MYVEVVPRVAVDVARAEFAPTFQGVRVVAEPDVTVDVIEPSDAPFRKYSTLMDVALFHVNTAHQCCHVAAASPDANPAWLTFPTRARIKPVVRKPMAKPVDVEPVSSLSSVFDTVTVAEETYSQKLTVIDWDDENPHMSCIVHPVTPLSSCKAYGVPPRPVPAWETY